ncbi:LuxR C-terminal-related transcriptional regulator [Miltoncostaea marina]|uniref:LuxR C-terminal-related transcriptional regulator n=1 Tax=Miltoncostaea marina TaxID=2843215 RepID=UPI001C3CFE37|nr:LuxR C-terminal-related transcriptional regulator [Miltoncostaea marina]
MGTFAAPPLIETKLRPPDRRPGLVARPGLLARLDEAVERHRLTLVGAGAGWGKSTLVGEWLAERGHPAAWVALDPSDDDPARFWGYVTEALRRAGVPVDDATAGALAGGGETLGAGLSSLLNAVAALERRAVLALDDFHCVSARAIHEAVAFLVERLPASLRVVIASRADPPIGLPRLRARGDLAEIRPDELRFSEAEAGALLNDGVGLRLAPGQVERLRARTEGWAAGLYLAGLSLRGRDDADAFIGEFAGDDRLVVDYLAEEVLGALPADRRAFLLRTSVLERLTAPLCDAVTGTAGAAGTLAELEASNLFLVPLDSRRGWYRYHHLFRELLRHELALTAPAEVAELHRRAAGWHLAEGEVDQAIEHLAAAGEIERAADLIAEHWADYHSSGWTVTTQRWLGLLPPGRAERDPRLCLAQALIQINLGRADDAAPWVDAAERAAAAPGAPGDPALVAAGVAACRSLVHLLNGEEPEAVAQGRVAHRLDASRGTWWRAITCLALGIALQAVNELDEARDVLEEAVAAAHDGNAWPPCVVALGHLAGQALERGDLALAERRAREAIELAAAERHAEYPHAAGAHATLARILAGRGEIDEALALAERSVALARRGRSVTETAYSVLKRGSVLLVAGDRDAARAAAAEGRRLLAPARGAVYLTAILERLEARLGEAGAGRPGPAAGGPAAAGPLTERELAVLRHLTGSASLREIAAELYVSHNTVKTQIRSIYRKLGAATRDEAVARARERGILPRPLAPDARGR